MLASLGTPLSSHALPRKELRFPRDAGAHPDFQTEWWYVTGYANVAGAAAAFGFQVTFFRSRVPTTQAMQSSLAAKQLIFAHAALTDVRGKKLWHDQRIARWSGAEPGHNPVDSASASTADVAVTLRDWSLLSQGSVLMATVQAAEFSLNLRLVPRQPVLLQGDRGLSRKGPQTAQASYYYSQPQLQAQGEVVLHGKRHPLAPGSTAWLDHEWSHTVLDPQAVGWDWIGINLFNGSALTAYQLRNAAGQALWDGGSFRAGDQLFTFARGEVLFKPVRTWRSPMSRASYPVEWIVRTPADYYTVKAVVDNQELDLLGGPVRGVGQQPAIGGPWLPGNDRVCLAVKNVVTRDSRQSASPVFRLAITSGAACAVTTGGRGLFDA
jgi:predicted secreted hydrolase